MNLLADVYRIRTLQGRGWMNLPMWDATTEGYTTTEMPGDGYQTATTIGHEGTVDGR